MFQEGTGWWQGRRVFGVVDVARLAGRWMEKEGLCCSFFVLGLLLLVAGGVWVVGGSSLLCVGLMFWVVLCRKQGLYFQWSLSSLLLFVWWQRKLTAVVGWRMEVTGWMTQGRWACVFWGCLCIVHGYCCIFMCRWTGGTVGAGLCAGNAWWVRWLGEVGGLWLPRWAVVWCWEGEVFVVGSLVESDGWKMCSIHQVAAVQNPEFGGSSRRLMEYVSVACSYGLRRCRIVSIVVRLHLARRDVRSYGFVIGFALVATGLATSQELEGCSGAFRQKDWDVCWVGFVSICLVCVSYFVLVFVFALFVCISDDPSPIILRL